MKTLNLLSVLNFVCSALTAILVVVPYALALQHIFISVLILFPFAVVTVISWVVALCAQDVSLKSKNTKKRHADNGIILQRIGEPSVYMSYMDNSQIPF